jgi:mannosylfructose-6-phosphate phosphatase
VGRMNLLISDLDGTLLGDDRALDGFSVWYAQVNDRLRLVYSSGRFLDSIRESIDRFHLPQPDAIICGVGTEIHDLTTGLRIVGWPEACCDWNPALVREVCGEFSEFAEQPRHLLSDFKISYYGYDLNDTFLSRLTRRLEEVGQEGSIIYSSRRDLDILPAATNKGTAATFLARHWGFHRDQVLVAGDSGNDLEMFRTGFRGIVVGNAQPELLSLHNQRVYHARAHFAEGVLEGLRHWLGDLWTIDGGGAARADRPNPVLNAIRGTRE